MSGRQSVYRITRVAETDSTNARVKEWAARGESEGAVLIADAQSAGRGRLGRSFYSPSGTGLYMSVLLRPRLAAEDMPLLTTAAAVAACRAIEVAAGQRPAVKWVNDVFLCGRKVCGILVEGVPEQYAVLGAGMNLCAPPDGFPADIADIAGAIFQDRAAAEAQKNGLAARFLNEFWELYRLLPDTAYLAEYRARCMTLGRRVLVPGEPACEAVAVDIDGRGALILRTDDGQTRRVAAGEISLRPLP